jgi:hypothetical protein
MSDISDERKEELRKHVKWLLVFGKGEELSRSTGIPLDHLKIFMNTGQILSSELVVLDVLADL